MGRSMNRPRLLDLFCGAGGAAKGYHDAGFEVIGVDIKPQPRYPYQFICGNVMSLAPCLIRQFRPAVVHASPPCKKATSLKAFSAAHHLELVPGTRDLLITSGLPYVMENVPGADLRDPVVLCGSMFDLGVRRHRLFESNMDIPQPTCDHEGQDAASPGYPVLQYHSGAPVIRMSTVIGVYGRGQGLGPGEIDLWKQAMGIDWMIRDEMAQAIPPAYTRFIGEQLMNLLAVAA
jgi:DNA (cytosine-5)-methyltransferase 1